MNGNVGKQRHIELRDMKFYDFTYNEVVDIYMNYHNKYNI